MNEYIFQEQDGGTVCLECASKKSIVGDIIKITDGYPDGCTCDYCNGLFGVTNNG